MDVYQAEFVNIQGLAPSYCPFNTPVQLNVFPFGGNLTGPGINGTTFNPFLAGPGKSHNITYSFSGSCGSTISQETYVYPFTSITFTGFNSSVYCQNNSIIYLQASPPGGFISGPGIQVITNGTLYNNTAIVANGSLIQFNPALVIPGTYAIFYAYTDTYGCDYNITYSISVFDNNPLVLKGLDSSYCINSPASNVTGSDHFGIISGPGIYPNNTWSAYFNASIAGDGTFTIMYSNYQASQCKVPEVNYTVTVYPLPVIGNLTSTSGNYVCVNSPSIELIGEPSGGIFTGPGVFSDSFFNASSLGVGSYFLEYQFTNSTSGCTRNSNFTINVVPLPQLRIYGYNPYACYGQVVPIVGNKLGGNFTGNGIQSVTVGGAYFNSIVAGLGTTTIVYSYTDSNGCYNQLPIIFYVYSNITLEIPTLAGNLVCNNNGFLPIFVYPPGGELKSDSPNAIIKTSNGRYYLDTSLLMEGEHTFIYNISQTVGRCPVTGQLNITLITVPTPTIEGITANSSICSNSNGQYSLSSNYPGGVFSGSGVRGNVFYVADAQVGLINISYFVTLPSGCNASNYLLFEVINSISCVTPLNLGLIIGVVVAAFCCLLCLLILFIILGRRKIKRSKEETEIELKDKIASDSLTQYSIIPGLILTDETIQKFELDEKWNVEISELEIEREVGRGAFGVVYKGKWRGKKVAVKKILTLDFNQQQIEDFAKEIKLMQNLRPHQNVVGLLGVVRSPLSIITTFYANGSLFSLFKNTQIELPQIIKILKDVASGMVKKKNICRNKN